MENLDLLEKLGKVAGIAGIAVGALVLIFGGIIQKNIFPNMTKEQGYSIIKMMILAASALAIMGIAAWVYTDFQKNKQEKKSSLLTKNLLGTIVNEAGVGIPSVKIYVVQNRETEDKSDSDGKFILPLEGNGQDYFDVVFDHPQYQTVRKKVSVDFEAETKEIVLDQITLHTSYPPEAEENLVPQANGTQTQTNETGGTSTSSSGTTSITIKYFGDDFGCRLNLNMTVGGRKISPTSNSFTLTNVPLGDQNYSISGTIFCDNGSCNASGQDVINITQGGTYYIMWVNENLDEYCDIGLLTEDQFRLLTGN